MYTGEIASLRHLPDGNERLLVEIDRVDLRIHDLIRLRRAFPAQ